MIAQVLSASWASARWLPDIYHLLAQIGKEFLCETLRENEMIGLSKLYAIDMDELLEIAKSRLTCQLTAKKKERCRVLDS